MHCFLKKIGPFLMSAILSASLTAISFPAEATTPREVHFSGDYAIGNLSLLENTQSKQPLLTHLLFFKALGPAQNVVVVPKGKSLGMETNTNFYRHSGDLRKLAPDDIDRLTIRFSSFTDEDEKGFVDAMKEVGRLNGLKELLLDKSDVQDSMLTGLNLASLNRLDCNLTPVKGGFLGSLNAKHLHTLRLNESSLNENNLKYLDRFPELEFLTVKHCRISTVGLDFICTRAPNIRVLDLGDNNLINDDNIGRLTQLKKLCHLTVVGTKISNVGLKKLTAVKSLQEVTLPKNSYSDNELAEIKKLLPGVAVGTARAGRGKVTKDDQVIFAPLH